MTHRLKEDVAGERIRDAHAVGAQSGFRLNASFALLGLCLVLIAGSWSCLRERNECTLSGECFGGEICIRQVCVPEPSYESDLGSLDRDANEGPEMLVVGGGDADDPVGDTSQPMSCSDPALMLCGKECVNLVLDDEHCGQCERRCGEGMHCVDQECVEVSVCDATSCDESAGQWCDSSDGKCKTGCQNDSECLNGSEQCDLNLNSCVCRDGATSCLSGCCSEPLQPAVLTALEGRREPEKTDLAVDAAGNVHLVYDFAPPSGDAAGLGYLHKPSGGNWAEPVIVDAEGEARHPSAALGANGNLVIAFRSARPGAELVLMRRERTAGGDWLSGEIIDNHRTSGYYPALAIDDQDHAHIVYGQFSPNQTMHVVDNNEPELLVDGGDASTRHAVAIGGDGSIHVSAVEPAGNLKLRYRFFDGQSWQLTEVVDGVSSGSESYLGGLAIILDRQQRPHIFFGKQDSGLKEIVQTESGWSSLQNIDNGPRAGEHLDVARDRQGVFHVVYYESDSGRLYYRHNRLGTWSSKESLAVPDVDSGRGCAIAVDKDDKVHISYISYDENREEPYQIQYLRTP